MVILREHDLRADRLGRMRWVIYAWRRCDDARGHERRRFGNLGLVEFDRLSRTLRELGWSIRTRFIGGTL